MKKLTAFIEAKILKCGKPHFFIMTILLLAGCQSNEELDVKMKSDSELKAMTDTYTYAD
ncbi:hypothetical protein [Rossellomorea sp. NS-SX7]|uniref:hypothetical protein n=1 Tax=Rossellomorea sp. NS-SX7 TaxID=3463856 RepID=UPI004058C604